MPKLSFAARIKKLFSFKNIKIDDAFFEDLTDALVEGDIGAKNAFEISDELKRICKEKRVSDEKTVIDELEHILVSLAKEATLIPEKNKTSVYIILGVNGVGKTTTAAKLALYYKNAGNNVVLAAADTFRAAAKEQLETHGKKIGIRVISHEHGSDPSAVVFDAADSVRAKGGGLVIADTAGRLHNKENLVKELQKIERVSSSKADENCCKKILVIDGTTGQNAVRQAEVFHEAVKIDSVIITKYDSSAKGGAAFALGKELSLPISFVCFGESYEAVSVFDSKKYASEFLGR